MCIDSDSNEVNNVKEKIKNGTPLYYYRATPFSQHGEFNYNGALKEEFFFQNMFSSTGKCNEYIEGIKSSLSNNAHKSILLIGNQGCGKTTFAHHLKRVCTDYKFVFFDYDADTSNATLNEYIEKMSYYLLKLLLSNTDVDKYFYDFYVKNKDLVNQKINASNNIENFFEEFRRAFVLRDNETEQHNFIRRINALYFNQILSLIVLWHFCSFNPGIKNVAERRKLVFCLDNLDVLVNKEIIEHFFKEYFRFVRNVDSIIQNLSGKNFLQWNTSYNTYFAFILFCRQHTWARVKEHYRHDNGFINISTLEYNITDAFEKRSILSQREKYISENEKYYGSFLNGIKKAKVILGDMDQTEEYHHNIYNLFDDDYRQCIITFEELLKDNPTLFDDYTRIKSRVEKSGGSLYGTRGIVYKALFEKFWDYGIFGSIGVLDDSAKIPLVSNARMILNYLNYHTYRKNEKNQKYVTFEKIVAAFDGIIKEKDINDALCAMFKLGYDSPWNELIAFEEIHCEEINDCRGLNVFITKAGHEYLSLIATHFEFFSTRVSKKREVNVPLFSDKSLGKSKSNKFTYNFEETISLVQGLVRRCCERISKFYDEVMLNRVEGGKEGYLQSEYVYADARVLHGERIIHTHIRYVDTYRLYVLQDISDSEEKGTVNKLLVGYIENYIKIGEDYPTILSGMSTEKLFPAFKGKIKAIADSNYKDFITRIDVGKDNR